MGGRDGFQSRGVRLVACGRGLTLTLVFAAAGVVHAQSLPGVAPAPTAPAVPAADATPPAPQAIPAAEVASSWQSSQSKLNAIQQNTVESGDARDILVHLADIEEEISQLADRDGLLLTVTISPDHLMTVQARWQGRAATYQRWSDSLSARVKELSDDLATLDALEGSWRKTEADASANALAKAVVERIADTIEAVEAMRILVRDRQNAVLTLQDRVAKLSAAGSTVLTQVADIRRAQQKNLLVVDSVALWTAVSRAQYEGADLEELRAPVVRGAEQTVEYFEREAEQTTGFVVAILVMMAAVTLLRARAAKWLVEDESLAPVLASLSRPISGGFLLAAVTFPWFFPGRPEIVAGLVSVLIIPPLLRFLSPLVSPSARRGLYGLSIWLVVDLCRDYLVPNPFANRLALLGEGLAVMAAMVWLLQPARLGRLAGATRWFWALGLGLRLSLLVVVAALISNVVGNVTLAQMLSRALLTTLFTAAVLVAAGHVLEFILVVCLRSQAARQLRMVRRRGELIRERARRLVRWGLALLWIWLTLRRFQVAEVLEENVDWLLNAPIGAGDFEVTLGHFVGAIVVIAVSIFLARFIRFVLEEDVMPRTNLPRGVPYTVSVLVGYGIIVLGSFAAVAAAGIDMSRFALVLSALSVGIGIGLQDVVNNFVSGLILLFERPLNVGDTVEVAHIRGEVRHIGLRSSTVRTWDGSEVVIPNSRFIADQFTNWTLSDRKRRIEIEVGVAYGSDPVKVIQIMVGVAQASEKILEAPPPYAIMTGFGDSALDFSLRAWTEDIDNWTTVRSGLLIGIDMKLAEEGIEIPFPQRDLHVVDTEPSPGGGPAGETA